MTGVFTIPPDRPFADDLAAGLLARFGTGPLDVAGVTLLLPTRRSCRAVAEAFLRAGGGRPAILPRMAPIGDVDEDAFAFVEDGADALDLPPAVAPLERRVMLARLIAAAADPATGVPPPMEQALGLADSLAALLDQVQAEGLDFAALPGLGLDLSEHWQRVLSVLATITALWPGILAKNGRIDPMARRVALMDRQAEAWRRAPPPGPVVAAGSTGSHPASARLMAVVAALPLGAVVLPGLDRGLSDAAWEALEPGHPQAGLKRLLAVLAAPRAAVADWTAPPAAEPPRRALVRAMFLPAAMPAERRLPAGAAAGVFRIDCANPREEAATVALILREALETPERTAILVTPDRALAQRVAAELGRWGVAIDDSAGVPLAQSGTGRFLRLAARAALSGFAPVDLLALLRHPLARGFAGVRAVDDFDRFLARGPAPAPGFADYRRRIEAAENACPEDRRLALSALVESLAKAGGEFADLLEASEAEFAALLHAHLAFVEALAAGAGGPWGGDDGEAANAFAADLLQHAALLGTIEPAAYGAVLDSLMAGIAVRPRRPAHPRIAILGAIEARMQSADLVILGAMNEGTWPRLPDPDPWMSRGMRTRFGLPPPERRIGLAAHDVMMALGAKTVVMTRAEKSGGAPTEPSRWLRRLAAALAAAGTGMEKGPWLDWARAMDPAPAALVLPPPPAPRPPVAVRPRRLSVTRVETLARDPYAIYAAKILRLYPLPAREEAVSPADLGSLMHKVLEGFVENGGRSDDPDACARLSALADAALRAHEVPPALAPFWRARIARALSWFVATDAPRMREVAEMKVELKGEWTFSAPAGPFTVEARADRLDVGRDGRATVIDFKTGSVPTQKEVASGYSPQLPLEGAILEEKGFPLPTAGVGGLEYWRINGAGEGGERRELADPAALVAAARDGIRALIARYDDPATPYPPQVMPGRGALYSDYLLLERLAEWRVADDDALP